MTVAEIENQIRILRRTAEWYEKELVVPDYLKAAECRFQMKTLQKFLMTCVKHGRDLAAAALRDR